MATTLSPSDRRRVLRAYIVALAALDQGLHRDPGAAENALALLQTCLEEVTPQTWPALWVEAQIAQADAYLLRQQGDPLENACMALACYRAAISVALDDMWQWAAEPPSSEEGLMRGDTDDT